MEKIGVKKISIGRERDLQNLFLLCGYSVVCPVFIMMV